MTIIETGYGVTRSRILPDFALELNTPGATLILSGLTPRQCDRLADNLVLLRDYMLDELEDVCECNGGDLPLFDHDRLCPRRLLAEYRGVEA